MGIVLARVDSRLFHGQVLEGWLPYTGATMVIVADDKAASNPLQKRIMEIAAPDDIKFKVEGIDDAVADLNSDIGSAEKIMILFSCPHDAFEAHKKGIKCNSINIGNINYVSGKKQITPSIALNDDDVRDLKGLVARGVALDVRCVPKEKPSEFDELIDKYVNACRGQR